MVKLNVAILAGNCEDTIALCIDSVKDVADKIIIIYDTTSRDFTKDIIDVKALEINQGKQKVLILERAYEHNPDVKFANSIARNFYLDYLKKNHKGEWCLVLDADEVCDEGINKVKEQVMDLENKKVGPYLLSPRMEHFIGDLGHVDATREIHFVQHRLFKIEDSLAYPNGEHPVLGSSKKEMFSGVLPTFTIWHFAYAREMFYIKERYLNHKAKSEIHSGNYLNEWYFAHLSGTYGKKQIQLDRLPNIIKKEFGLDEDWFYFRDRLNHDVKYFLMIYQWKQFFKLDPEENTIMDLGCGIGHYMFAWHMAGFDVRGVEISPWAKENTHYAMLKNNIYCMDISDQNLVNILEKVYASANSFVTAIDVLEHLTYQQLDVALENMYKIGYTRFLFSIPFIGDPNLEADSTHIIKETKEWWLNKLESKGFKIQPTPEHFLFKEQIILAVK